jgi:mono/diheme cytochrome c family protein
MIMRGPFVLLGLVTVMVTVGVPAPAAQASRPAAAATGNVEHGRYIAERVAMCVECHSGRDGQGNLIENQRYMGGLIPFTPPWPNDWAMRAPRNKGLPGYDDALALRLLTEGSIGRNGAQLRPPMPRFRMTPRDAADVIAFLRSLP